MAFPGAREAALLRDEHAFKEDQEDDERWGPPPSQLAHVPRVPASVNVHSPNRAPTKFARTIANISTNNAYHTGHPEVLSLRQGLTARGCEYS